MQDASHLVITDTHAHGIARHFLASRTEASAQAIRRAHAECDEAGILVTRKGVRRLFSAVHGHLDRHAWNQESWTDRHESRGVWLLPVFEQDELVVTRFTVSSHKSLLTRWGLRRLLCAPLHAIARSHQRLHDYEWAAVEQQLKICALYACAVHAVSEHLGLSQFGLPACDGLLVGEVSEKQLQARTFITPPFSRRYQLLLDAWMRFTLSGVRGHLDTLTALTMARRSTEGPKVLELLATALSGPEVGFLASPHESGHDHVGVMWEAARDQARRDAVLEC